MKQAILLLPLLVLALVVPAAAEESPLEKQLGKQIEETEARLQAAALALRTAKDPEEQKKLTEEIQTHHQHLAVLHRRRETRRLQRTQAALVEQKRAQKAKHEKALAKRLDFVRVNLKVDEVSPSTAVALLAEPLEIDVIVDSSADAKPITLDLEDVTLREALETIAQAAGLEVRLDARLVRIERPRRVVPHEISKAAMPEGLVPWAPTDGWNQPKLKDLRLRLAAEKEPAKHADLEDEIRIREEIERLQDMGFAPEQLRTMRVSQSFADTPLEDVTKHLEEAVGIRILIPKKLGQRRISIDLKDQPVPDAVAWLARTAGGGVSTSGKGLFVIWPLTTSRRAAPTPTPSRAAELRALRDEIRALRAEIAEIKAILIRER